MKKPQDHRPKRDHLMQQVLADPNRFTDPQEFRRLLAAMSDAQVAKLLEAQLEKRK